MLATGFGLGLNFLMAWQAWRDDPARPGMLHFVSTTAQAAAQAELLRAASAYPALEPLAAELAAQWHGLLPGTHRLAFEGGRVLLTLGVGDAQTWLRAQHLCLDSVYLDGMSLDGDTWDANTLKAVARCCRRGTQLTSETAAPNVMDGLKQCGFSVAKRPGLAPEFDTLHAVFNPPWEPKIKLDPAWPQPRPAQRCIVIGAGLAGAATAASLARRGWTVMVLDANPAPAGGASGLPAGLLAPHVSSDDGVLSRLSRSGLRATWRAVAELLAPDDGQRCGVLQRRVDTSARLPADWRGAGADWSHEAGASQINPAFAGDAQAPLWHPAGGWVKPARLVEALLQTPGVTLKCGQTLTALQRLNAPSEPISIWQALDASGHCLAEAELVVVAAGPASAALVVQASACGAPPLQAVRGQVLWGEHPHGDEQALAAALPATPVNGLGGLIPDFPSGESESKAGQRPHWLMGATFERDEAQALLRHEDTQQLLGRLVQLWPSAGQALAPKMAAGQVQAWAGVRCVSPDRLPLVGPLSESEAPGLWLCTAMGSRGLTFAVLCAELLAAWLHAEPLPLEKRLARHLLASRFNDFNKNANKGVNISVN